MLIGIIHSVFNSTYLSIFEDNYSKVMVRLMKVLNEIARHERTLYDLICAEKEFHYDVGFKIIKVMRTEPLTVSKICYLELIKFAFSICHITSTANWAQHNCQIFFYLLYCVFGCRILFYNLCCRHFTIIALYLIRLNFWAIVNIVWRLNWCYSIV